MLLATKDENRRTTIRMERKYLVLIVVMLLALHAGAPVSASNIAVRGADTICNVSTTCPQDIPDASPRIIVEYTSTIAQLGLQFTPQELIAVAKKVTSRMIVAYACSTEQRALQAMPADILCILEEVPEQRLIVGYAELNAYLPLVYPKELMNDTIPPVITEVSVLTVTGNSAAITWLTDEFADSIVNYGVNSTVYTATSTDNLYVKEHRMALAGLSSGTTYYFVVKSADRSGNSAVSMEYTFTTEG